MALGAERWGTESWKFFHDLRPSDLLRSILTQWVRASSVLFLHLKWRLIQKSMAVFTDRDLTMEVQPLSDITIETSWEHISVLSLNISNITQNLEITQFKLGWIMLLYKGMLWCVKFAFINAVSPLIRHEEINTLQNQWTICEYIIHCWQTGKPL